MLNALTSALAEYAVAFELPHLARDDRIHLDNAIVNWVGCALGGAQHPTVDALARASAVITPNGVHQVIGRRDRHGLVEAVALDCLSSAVLAFDDTHLETVLHPTGPVAAALFGQARLQTVNGTEFLRALHIGMEIECRAGLAVAAIGSGVKRGWYLTGVAGGIGAAAAVGRLLNFDAGQMSSAIGLAAARASGNRGTHGSMAAAYVPAVAAESGLLAAHLTQAGLLCGARAFDGPSGLLELVTEVPAIERALAGLGTSSEAGRTAFKPYPAGIVAHPVIDGCLALIHDHGVTPDSVISLTFRISSTAHDLVANKFPRSVIEAQVSLFYWAAVALDSGKAGIAQAAESLVYSPRIRALQEIMTAKADPGLADDQCVVVAKLREGREFRISIDHAVGSAARPMTSVDIDRKFHALAGLSVSTESAAQLIRFCRSFESLEDVARLLTI